jgi:hypothetical protein
VNLNSERRIAYGTRVPVKSKCQFLGVRIVQYSVLVICWLKTVASYIVPKEDLVYQHYINVGKQPPPLYVIISLLLRRFSDRTRPNCYQEIPRLCSGMSSLVNFREKLLHFRLFPRFSQKCHNENYRFNHVVEPEPKLRIAAPAPAPGLFLYVLFRIFRC